jgi:hypothetical protein
VNVKSNLGKALFYGKHPPFWHWSTH